MVLQVVDKMTWAAVLKAVLDADLGRRGSWVSIDLAVVFLHVRDFAGCKTKSGTAPHHTATSVSP